MTLEGATVVFNDQDKKCHEYTAIFSGTSRGRREILMYVSD